MVADRQVFPIVTLNYIGKIAAHQNIPIPITLEKVVAAGIGKSREDIVGFRAAIVADNRAIIAEGHISTVVAGNRIRRRTAD